MSRAGRNVHVAGTGLAERLRKLRLDRGLSKAEFARRAGLTWRAIQEIETGRRERILEDTLLRLARALDVTAEELLGRALVELPDAAAPAGGAAPIPRAGRSARRRAILLGTIAVALPGVVIGAKAVQEYAGAPVSVRAEGSVVVVERRLHAPLRLGPYRSSVRSCTIAPWRGGRVVLYSLGHSGEDGGRTFAVDATSGRELWSVEPPYAQLAEFFGADFARVGAFGNAEFDHSAGKLLFGNVDGVGDPELVVAFAHETWFPSYVDIVRSDGNRLGSYLNWGHLYTGAVADLDADGKDEVVVAGTTNAKCYQGATVILLDDLHCTGASVDSLVRPDCSLRDGSLARLVIPNFDVPYPALLGIDRLSTSEVVISRDGRGDARIVIDVIAGPDNESFIVTLDGSLRPLSHSMSDAMIRLTRPWPAEVRDRFLGKEHLDRWLSGHRLFGALPAGDAAL